MKNNILLLLLLCAGTLFAQEQEPVELQTPSENKSLVYFARRSAVGPLIKFRIYDGDTYLGKLSANRYITYECDPGLHVFVAKSENSSFVEAELEAGKVYVLDVVGKMGIAYARVDMVPLEKSNKRYEKEKVRFIKFVGKKKGELLSSGIDRDSEDAEADHPQDGKNMTRYNEMKGKGKKIKALTADMYFEQ